MNEPVEVQEKAPRPQGLLPKHVQSWLLVGLAFLMIAIMWLTGGKKPPTPAKMTPPVGVAQPPVEVNETKIADLQNRIEDLQRQQLVAQNALAAQTRLLTDTGNPPASPQPATSDAPENTRREDPIANERKNRTYTSLFASNVALTYRTPLNAPPQTNPGGTMPDPAVAETAQVAELLKQLQPNPVPATAPAAPQSNSAPPETAGKEEGRNPAAVPDGTANAAAGKTYLLLEGTILESVLINRLDGQFAGPVECLVSTDVYSNDRQHLLIPAGSKILGDAKKVDTFGQTRLAVAFHRVLMPDGYSVTLDQFKGLDQIGSTGLRDQVNNHYLRIFGTSLAIGILGAVGEADIGNALTANGSDLMRQGLAASMAQSASQILDRFLNITPTVTIREGHRVKIFLSNDLALPDYNNHQMPSNL